MSFGKMNQFIELVQTKKIKDSEGFVSEQDEVLASISAYREGRHGTEKWANRATFSQATDLFRFRAIPNLAVTTDMVIIHGEERFSITSVEAVRGRGMYVEALAERVTASG